MARRIINHHTSYTPEIKIPVYDGEHQILGLIKRYSKKTVSKPFLKELQRLTDEMMPRAFEKNVMEKLKLKQKPKSRRTKK